MAEHEYFSRRARGGMNASRVDSQDTVAATIALDLIRGGFEPLDSLSPSRPIELFCEGQEDLEIIQCGKKVLVSVKDKTVTVPQIKREIESKLEPALDGDSSGTIYLRVSCLRGVDSKARTLESDIGHLRERLESKSGGADASDEFQTRWSIAPDVASKLWIDDWNLGRENPSSEALFAHSFRLSFPTTTLTDRAIEDLRFFLADQVFAPARRNRNRVDLLEVEAKLLEIVSPLELRYQVAEVRATPFGYVRSNDLQGNEQEINLLRRSMKHAMRSWRRGTFLERISVLRVNCMRCNHPMMANFGGRNGYACPDCGFTPFGSLFYACECGAPVLIESNPQIGGTEFLLYAIRRTRNEDFKCTECDRIVDPRKVISRIFFAPIPWPIPKNVDSILVAKRMALGWGKEHLTPEEAENRMVNGGEDWECYLPSAEESTHHSRVCTLFRRVLALAIILAFIMLLVGL